MTLAMRVLLAIAFAIIVASIATADARRILGCFMRAFLLPDAKASMSECRTLMSDSRTFGMTSLRSPDLLPQQDALSRQRMVMFCVPEAAAHRGTTTVACVRSPCRTRASPVTAPTENQPSPVAPQPEASY
jgi:hypothetical protein